MKEDVKGLIAYLSTLAIIALLLYQFISPML